MLNLLDDNNLLSFDDFKTIVKVSQFKEQKENQLQKYAEQLFLEYGIMRESSQTLAFGQINTLSWTLYPSDGRDCELLILGEKNWRKGKIKVCGSFELSQILEELPKSFSFNGINYDSYERHLKNMIRKELENININDVKEIFKIKLTLEFISENLETIETNIIYHQKSPLDDIRKSITETPL